MSEHDGLAELIAQVAGASADRRSRQAALASLAPVLGAHARRSGVRAVAAGRWLTDVVATVAPRIPIRDEATLLRHHPGRSRSDIATMLVDATVKSTAALGAAAGGLAAVEFAAPPLLLATPIQLSAEVVAVAVVEIKLVAELHELARRPAAGSGAERGAAYLMSWARRRALPATAGGEPVAVSAALSVAAKRELRGQLMRRLGRSTTTLGPMLTGAVAGAEINRRASRSLGGALLADLGFAPELSGRVTSGAGGGPRRRGGARRIG